MNRPRNIPAKFAVKWFYRISCEIIFPIGFYVRFVVRFQLSQIAKFVLQFQPSQIVNFVLWFQPSQIYDQLKKTNLSPSYKYYFFITGLCEELGNLSLNSSHSNDRTEPKSAIEIESKYCIIIRNVIIYLRCKIERHTIIRPSSYLLKPGNFITPSLIDKSEFYTLISKYSVIFEN